MEITRRVFTRGLSGTLSGVLGRLVVPGNTAVASALPVEPGFDDAYEKLLSEYIRVEEAAIAAGRTAASQTGAATWEGQQLEGFIAELDGRVDIKATARQIYSEFKERFREAARQAREKLMEDASQPEKRAEVDTIATREAESDAGRESETEEMSVVEQPPVSVHVDETQTDGDERRLS